MKRYLVTWMIEVDAEDVSDAGQQAQTIMRDPNSIATVFNIIELESGEKTELDLSNKT